MISYREETFWLAAAEEGAVDAEWLVAHPHVCLRAVRNRESSQEAVPAVLADAAATVAIDAGYQNVPDTTTLGVELAAFVAALHGVPAAVQLRLLKRFRHHSVRDAAVENPTTSARVLRRVASYGPPFCHKAALHPNLSPAMRAKLWREPASASPTRRYLEGWAAMPRARRRRALSGLCDPDVSVSMVTAMWPVLCRAGEVELQRRVLERLLVAEAVSSITVDRLIEGLRPDSDASVVDAVAVGTTTAAVAGEPSRVEAVARVAVTCSAVERAVAYPEWIAGIGKAPRWRTFAVAVVDHVAAADPDAARRCAEALLGATPRVLRHLDPAGWCRVAADESVGVSERFEAVRRYIDDPGADLGAARGMLERLDALESPSAAALAWDAYLNRADPAEVLDAPAAVICELGRRDVIEVCFAELAAAGNTTLFRELQPTFPGTFGELLAVVTSV